MNVIIRPYAEPDEQALKQCILNLKEYESQFDEHYLTDAKSVDDLFYEIRGG